MGNDGRDNAFSIDCFPCALVVTDHRGKLLYGNVYFGRIFGYDISEWLGYNISGLVSRAGNVMLESYVMPLVLQDGECEEIQLTIVDAQGEKIPVVISGGLCDDVDKMIYWSVSRAIERDRLHQELLDARRVVEDKAMALESISRTDDLSGLFNRRELRRRSEIIMQSAERSRQPMSLLVFDIDHFKAINDEYGHLIGDDMIRAIGELLTKHARHSDVVARFGGDEFVLLLPDTDQDQVLNLSERLQAGVGRICVDGVGCTVSMGSVTAPVDLEVSFEELFRVADRSLYRAKEAGQGNTRSVSLDGAGPE